MQALRARGAQGQGQAAEEAVTVAEPQVVNLREVNLRDPDVVRIDRRTAWGNPYVVGIDGTRAEVIEAYRRWIKGRPELLERLGELEGKRLACWCAPRACHGDVLAELVAEHLEAGERVEGERLPDRACPRCNSRYGMSRGRDLCANCRRDMRRAGLPVAEPAPGACEPVSAEAEGWAWMLTSCRECGRQSLWALCSSCRASRAASSANGTP